MPTLRELQHSFWQALASDPGCSAANPRLLDTIEPSTSMNAARRLQVYVDAYFWRIEQVMRDNFPRVAAQLSTEQFHDLVRDYLRLHPSRHPSIAYIGVHFAEFLRSRSLPCQLADIALLEWTHSLAFESKDALALSASALREVAVEDWPTLRFRPIPALHVIQIEYPVHLLWGDELPSVDTPQPTRLRVWRTPELKVRHSVLDMHEAAALHSMRRGDDFATICQSFADLADEQAAQESIALLLRWLEDGILAAP